MVGSTATSHTPENKNRQRKNFPPELSKRYQMAKTTEDQKISMYWIAKKPFKKLGIPSVWITMSGGMQVHAKV